MGKTNTAHDIVASTIVAPADVDKPCTRAYVSVLYIACHYCPNEDCNTYVETVGKNIKILILLVSVYTEQN